MTTLAHRLWNWKRPLYVTPSVWMMYLYRQKSSIFKALLALRSPLPALLVPGNGDFDQSSDSISAQVFAGMLSARLFPKARTRF